ncbi:hypothetical protein PoB_003811100 [Plakobranchus ocellatus]|uniref:Reverse transcriptase domain-containing protein n=1 Tax=Plakobranchus ocellatus TaxID=259542 RepID=A0AAV4AK88_9GAST|nr:hypothetical protein PoB_003811100 [Plakobranchus ocellatus]
MEAATEVIPKVKRKAKQKWMTEEISNLMEERRCANGNKEKYEQIHKKVQEKCNMSECELHRTISLMSHITKILLKIIMLRIRNKIKPEIAEEQCGFVEDKGTSNAIYILRTLIERALEVQKDVYLCLID